MPGPFPDNLPSGDALTLDHVGHFVADPAAATIALEALGFSVTGWTAQETRDPETGKMSLTGTGNVCVMLRHGYVEVLGHTADTPIGLEFRQALARRAGLHLLAFATRDAAALHGRLSADWAMRPLARFGRPVMRDDGVMEEARFSVARLEKGVFDEGRVQFVTHHTEALVWQEADLTHPNGALGLDAVLIAAAEPLAEAKRFGALLGTPCHAAPDGAVIHLERGRLEFVTPKVSERLLGEPLGVQAPAFVAYRLRFADAERAMQHFAGAGLTVCEMGGTSGVRAPAALGKAAILISDTPQQSTS